MLEKLRAIGDEEHVFTGSIARYITVDERSIEILIIWKNTEMPDETTRQQDLLFFQRAFADVIDWETIQVSTKDVYLHT